MNYNVLLIEVLIVITLCIAFYKTVYLYHYTIACFKNVTTDERLQRLYQTVVDGKLRQNIKLSPLGVLYMYVIIPQNVPNDLELEYLKDHLQFLEEAFGVQSLYGLVKTKKRKFVTEINNQHQVIYLIKFIPILQGLTLRRLLLVIIIILLVIIMVLKYNVGAMLWQLI